jgi:uncharacterized surface protein with fasciclin (FAS1) repeats
MVVVAIPDETGVGLFRGVAHPAAARHRIPDVSTERGGVKPPEHKEITSMRTTTRAAVAAAAVAVAASGMLSLSAATATADPVGPGCGDYVRQVPVGPGSVMGMAADPVTVAASNNPLLTTLTAALSGQLNPNVNLVNTLNGGEFTVFAPTDDAFGKIPPATIDSLKTDSATLTKILTYHVVPGRVDPANVVGTHMTVEGANVTVTGSPDALKVITHRWPAAGSTPATPRSS